MTNTRYVIRKNTKAGWLYLCREGDWSSHMSAAGRWMDYEYASQVAAMETAEVFTLAAGQK